MSLTEKSITSRVEVINRETFYIVQVQEANLILKDGKEISRALSRYVLDPLSDLSGEGEPVLGICNLLFTEEVKAGYENWMEETQTRTSEIDALSEGV